MYFEMHKHSHYSMFDGFDKIKNIVKDTWAEQNIKCDIKTMNVEQNGAQIVSNED